MAIKDADLIVELQVKIEALKKNIKEVIVGQENVIEHLILTLLCNGHCLLIGVPGLGKTLMVHTISSLLDLEFNRIQFTPDLMPADITGTDVLEEDSISHRRTFRFVKGPLFANVILADEINRTPPKTQAALLQAMQEHQITSSGVTYQLSEPFFVLATQNPIEQEGTYPLPEAELDRFMFSVKIEYPSKEEEIDIVLKTTSDPLKELKSLIKGEEVLQYQKLVRRIPVSRSLVDIAVSIVRKTRPVEGSSSWIKKYIMWGAGPRASQNLILGAKAKAAIEGRFTPCKDDIISFIEPVLQHRLILSFAAEAEGIQVEDILKMLMKELNKEGV